MFNILNYVETIYMQKLYLLGIIPGHAVQIAVEHIDSNVELALAEHTSSDKLSTNCTINLVKHFTLVHFIISCLEECMHVFFDLIKIYRKAETLNAELLAFKKQSVY